MKYKLGEIFEVGSGGTPSKSHPEYYGGSIPWIKTGDLKCEYLYEAEDYITKSGLSNSSAKMYEPDTVLIAMYGATIGATSILKIDACTNQACAAFKKSEKVLPEYLYYFFKSQKERFVKDGVGGAQPNISAGYLRNVEMEVPALDRQTEIVDILDKVNRVIDQRKLELEELDNLIKSRFVDMFGHQSHNEKQLKYGKIDDVAEIFLGITHTPTYVENGVMFISAKNTSGDYLDLSDVKYISREEFEGAPQGSKPKKNDVLFSRVGSNLGHPVILEEELELCTFVSLGFLRAKGSVTSNYLKHWMRDEFFAKQVQEHVKGGGQPNLNTGWLKEFKIIIPSLEEQREFDIFCTKVDKLKFEIQKSLDETQLLMDSLMQEYFG